MTQIAPAIKEKTRLTFPLATCVASIVMTSLGLTAAAINIQWGAQPPAGDALRHSWLYVQMMLMMTWLMAWPVAAASRTLGSLAFEATVILIGALPAIAMAALLSSVTAPAGVAAAALQFSFALFAMGLILVSARSTAWLIVLPILAVIMPLLAYVMLEFLPAGWSFWTPGVPAFAIHDAARAMDWSTCVRIFWISTFYAAIGTVLIITRLLIDRRAR